jgi:hypothetical protein
MIWRRNKLNSTTFLGSRMIILMLQTLQHLEGKRKEKLRKILRRKLRFQKFNLR